MAVQQVTTSFFHDEHRRVVSAFTGLDQGGEPAGADCFVWHSRAAHSLIHDFAGVAVVRVLYASAGRICDRVRPGECAVWLRGSLNGSHGHG